MEKITLKYIHETFNEGKDRRGYALSPLKFIERHPEIATAIYNGKVPELRNVAHLYRIRGLDPTKGDVLSKEEIRRRVYPHVKKIIAPTREKMVEIDPAVIFSIIHGGYDPKKRTWIGFLKAEGFIQNNKNVGRKIQITEEMIDNAYDGCMDKNGESYMPSILEMKKELKKDYSGALERMGMTHTGFIALRRMGGRLGKAPSGLEKKL
ncbi:hypothetical protein ACFLZZ_02945 [Nanoarchaeota archaeon]